MFVFKKQKIKMFGLCFSWASGANYNRFHDLQYLYLSFKNGWSQEAFTTYEERGFSVEQYALVLMDHVFRGLVLSSDAEQPSVNNPSAALLELGKHYARAVAAISGSGCHPNVVLHIDEHTCICPALYTCPLGRLRTCVCLGD